MPKLDAIIKDRDSKKFSKKSYRSWDLTGNITKSKDDSLHYYEHDAHPVINDSSKPQKEVYYNEENSYQLDTNQISEKETSGYPSNITQISTQESSDINSISNKKSLRYQFDINFDPTSLSYMVEKTSGIQRKILNLVVDICAYKGNLITGPIETARIANHVNTTVGTVKISIKRLIDKGFLIRYPGKASKGGFVILGIVEEVYNLLKINNSELNAINNSVGLLQNLRYQSDINPIYSSNSYINNTTIKDNTDFLPNEWESIDYEPLSSIGFSKTQIKQLIDKNNPELVQQSIYHFAYGLEHSQKLKKYEDPLNVLMGVLRKGQSWFEKDYKSPQEIAQAQLIELKKAELEKKKELEEQAFQIALANWQNKLSNEEISEIAPARDKSFKDLTPPKAKLITHFKENVWPVLKKEYLVE
ncbi:TPA: hypothetical protein GJ770_04060 [Legionella pneumophila]|nr:hypothetical protein [Legionella pneumophila]